MNALAGRGPSSRVSLLAVLTGLAGCALIAWGTAARRGDVDLASLPLSRRFWEDLTVAMSRHLETRAAAPVRPAPVGSFRGQAFVEKYQRFIVRAVANDGLRPWQFWRTIRLKSFERQATLELRDSDDAGRAVLLEHAFRLLGGVAPFLPLWMGALVASPLLLWVSWELWTSGHGLAAVVFVLLAASSPFLVDVLSLPYSAVAFYAASILMLAAVAAYGVLGRSTPLGFFVRAALAGTVLAACVAARSGSMLLVPGFVLALAAAAHRVFGAGADPSSSSRRRWAGFAAGVALLLLPLVLAAPQRRHGTWEGVWEGLGDFDRTRGHSWYDPEARNALRRAGLDVPPGAGVGFVTPEAQAVFRRLVLEDVRADPAWYAAILVKRTLATLSQWKLRPFGPWSGTSMAPSRFPEEGVIDVYYRMTKTVDFVGLGRAEAEVPVALWWGPTLVIVLAWLLGTRVRGLKESRERLGRPLAVLAVVAAGALVQPVLITTASALETEAFVLVYWLGLGFAVEEAAVRLQRRPRSAVS
jgi:hypothetical protein